MPKKIRKNIAGKTYQRLAVIEPSAAVVEEDEVSVPDLWSLPLLHEAPLCQRKRDKRKRLPMEYEQTTNNRGKQCCLDDP